METFSKIKKNGPKEQIYYVNQSGSNGSMRDESVYKDRRELSGATCLESRNFASTNNLINNYELINNDTNSAYNTISTKYYGTSSLGNQENYVKVEDTLNKVDISVLRVQPTEANDLTSLASPSTNPHVTVPVNPNVSNNNEDIYNNGSRRIRLGNDNYVISIQPLKDECANQMYAKLGSGTAPSEYSLSKESIITKSDHRDSLIVNKTTVKVPSICSCCSCCVQLFTLFLQCFQCLFSCLCKPLCCAAGIFGAFAAAAGVVALGVFGIIPVPVNWQNTICNPNNHRNVYITYENVTFSDKAYTTFSTATPSMTTTLTTIIPTTMLITNATDTILNATMKNYVEELLRQKIEMKKITEKVDLINDCKKSHDITTYSWIPIFYQITLLPILPEYDFTLTSGNIDVNSIDTQVQSMEMKINAQITINCNRSTNILRLKTREFSSITLRIYSVIDPLLNVVNWNLDPSMRLLNVLLNRNCEIGAEYKLNITIAYKNYGSLMHKLKKGSQGYYYAAFSETSDIAFPYLIDGIGDLSLTPISQSVYNITVASVKSSYVTIYNMDTVKKYENDGFEYTQFKSTPYVGIDTVAILIGKFLCKSSFISENENQFKLRVCSLIQLNEQAEKIIRYTGFILGFYKNYTKKAYPFDKLDIVVLPVDEVDIDQVQLGIIYLPVSLVSSMMDADDLVKAQIRSKLLLTLSKQLSKHWLYNCPDCSCSIWKDTNINPFNFITAILKNEQFIKTDCSNGICIDKEFAPIDKTLVESNLNCFLLNGVMNWLSYTVQQSLQNEVYDLLEMDWYLLRKSDKTLATGYGNADSNSYDDDNDFARLVDKDNMIGRKFDLKSLMFVKTINTIYQPQKFQAVVSRYFKDFNLKWLNDSAVDISNGTMSNTTTRQVMSINEIYEIKNTDQFTGILETFAKQYSIFRLNLSVSDIVLNWIITDNDLVLNVNRDYNKRSIAFQLDTKNDSYTSLSFAYPFYWSSGDAKMQASKLLLDFGYSVSELNDKISPNLKWIQNSTDLISDLPGADKWIIGNYMRLFAQFRINYDLQNWLLLTEQLSKNAEGLSLIDRNQLVDDSFYLSNNGKISIKIPLSILEYLPIENSYLPWKLAIDHIKLLLSYIEDDSSIYGSFREYIIQLMKSTYHRLKWGENVMDTLDDKLIRILVVDLMCYLDYEDCVENSVKQLTDSIKINVNNIPKHLSTSIFCTAVRYTGINEWNYLWTMYVRQPKSSKSSYSLIQSLSCSSQIWILNLLLHRLVYENYMPRKDLPIAFEYITRNPVGKYVIWNHVSQNYQSFYNKIGNDADLFMKIIEVSTRQFKLKYEVKQVYDFLQSIGLTKTTNTKSSNRNLYYKNIFNNIQTRINSYINWNEWNSKDLNQWLNRRLKKQNEF